eukprot:TRINITY_DN4370_c0_g2_i1.p1 TRINITY_DN4370_c0_g2~~TRINITY_DN4370_c0_g2_i1.p1  ORF type:complete len:313 (-),score=59.44 TRINITY_DN4370_c0_g2_i1:7-945(-)
MLSESTIISINASLVSPENWNVSLFDTARVELEAKLNASYIGFISQHFNVCEPPVDNVDVNLPKFLSSEDFYSFSAFCASLNLERNVSFLQECYEFKNNSWSELQIVGELSRISTEYLGYPNKEPVIDFPDDQLLKQFFNSIVTGIQCQSLLSSVVEMVEIPVVEAYEKFKQRALYSDKSKIEALFENLLYDETTFENFSKSLSEKLTNCLQFYRDCHHYKNNSTDYLGDAIAIVHRYKIGSKGMNFKLKKIKKGALLQLYETIIERKIANNNTFDQMVFVVEAQLKREFEDYVSKLAKKSKRLKKKNVNKV